MNVVHLIPVGSAFNVFVRDRASKAGHTVLEYTVVPYIGIIELGVLWSLLKRYKDNKNTLFVFHQIPSLTLLCISYLLKNVKYALYFWGGDYYRNFLPESYLEAKAYKKIHPSKKFGHSRSGYPTRRFKVRRFLSHMVVKRAAGIVSLTEKQLRILRWQHFKLFRSPLDTPYYKLVGYNSFTEPEFRRRDQREPITFLICHSAARTVNHLDALAIVKRYREHWGVPVNVRGFLSYGGSSTAEIDLLETTLRREASFADNVHFERRFLEHENLVETLKGIDVAVFSCIRDEGVGLLSRLAGMGGLLVFYRMSFNFDLFMRHCRNKTLSVEDFVALSPSELLTARDREPDDPPDSISYEELSTMKYDDGKLMLA